MTDGARAGVLREAQMVDAFVEHRSDLARVARRHHAKGADGEDIVQDVFAALWARPERFDEARGALSGYLRMATRGRAIDTARSECSRKERDVRAAQRDGHLAEGSADEVALERVLEARARSLLDELPAGERDAITLAFFHGHPYREVAGRVGLPEGTVKARIRAGLATLRSQLVADGYSALDLS